MVFVIDLSLPHCKLWKQSLTLGLKNQIYQVNVQSDHLSSNDKNFVTMKALVISVPEQQISRSSSENVLNVSPDKTSFGILHSVNFCLFHFTVTHTLGFSYGCSRSWF